MNLGFQFFLLKEISWDRRVGGFAFEYIVQFFNAVIQRSSDAISGKAAFLLLNHDFSYV